MKPDEAKRLAFIAHTACGQFRADGVTPYIAHPVRVAKLTQQFDSFAPGGPLVDRLVAAYLHDVIEDTHLTRDHLVELGVSYAQIDIIERLTKAKPNDPATPDYYQGIAESVDALVVKCADRCANLEDALAELQPEEPKEPRRWGRYVDKTVTDVLPMYVTFPSLLRELQSRLDAISEALPDALARRSAYVERKKLEHARP